MYPVHDFVIIIIIIVVVVFLTVKPGFHYPS